MGGPAIGAAAGGAAAGGGGAAGGAAGGGAAGGAGGGMGAAGGAASGLGGGGFKASGEVVAAVAMEIMKMNQQAKMFDSQMKVKLGAMQSEAFNLPIDTYLRGVSQTSSFIKA